MYDGNQEIFSLSFLVEMAKMFFFMARMFRFTYFSDFVCRAIRIRRVLVFLSQENAFTCTNEIFSFFLRKTLFFSGMFYC